MMGRSFSDSALIYSMDVRSFKDGNQDGLGDIQGLIEKLDYLADLGVEYIWLAPFFQSKAWDDGYDVMDYFQIDPQLGSMEDFMELVDHSRVRGIKRI